MTDLSDLDRPITWWHHLAYHKQVGSWLPWWTGPGLVEWCPRCRCNPEGLRRSPLHRKGSR